jgi:hypothetical protein
LAISAGAELVDQRVLRQFLKDIYDK